MTTTEYDSKKSQVFPIRTFQISTITDIFTTQRAHHFIYLSVNKAKLSSKGDISIAYIIIYNIMAQLITKTFYLGNFSSIIFSLLVIQSCNANINARNVNWGIQIDSIKSTGFSFVEKRLNAPVGSLIAYVKTKVVIEVYYATWSFSSLFLKLYSIYLGGIQF